MLRLFFVIFLMAFATVFAQIAVPNFGTRGNVEGLFLDTFMTEFRRQLAADLMMKVDAAEVITAGIAGSLRPDMAFLISDVMKQRYALSGEITKEDRLVGKAPYSVRILLVDSQLKRSSDIISLPLSESSMLVVISSLSKQVEQFISSGKNPERGSAALFISSDPPEAEIFIDGIKVAETPLEQVLMLKPGSYEVELRKEGFKPVSRLLELRDERETMERFVLAPIVGGSIQLKTYPNALVFLDAKEVGMTPLTLQALPGNHSLYIERPGFKPSSFNVRVENYRVSRVEHSLEPIAAMLLFWNVSATELVFIDGVLQTRSYLADIAPGSYTVDVRTVGEKRSFSVTLLLEGVYELDFTLEQAVRLD